MKTIFALFISGLFVVACGTNSKDKTIAAVRPTTTTQLPTTPTFPTASPVASPAPGTSLWTASDIAEQTQNCAEAGSSSYTLDQWNTFCQCTYQTAATRWTLQEFSNNFSTHFDELLNDGTVVGCMNKAGISDN